MDRDSISTRSSKYLILLGNFDGLFAEIEKINKIRGLPQISRKIPIFLENYEIFSVSDIREFFAKRKI